jgi:hypothetical protein
MAPSPFVWWFIENDRELVNHSSRAGPDSFTQSQFA